MHWISEDCRGAIDGAVCIFLSLSLSGAPQGPLFISKIFQGSVETLFSLAEQWRIVFTMYLNVEQKLLLNLEKL